jgi:hypothetical protein
MPAGNMSQYVQLQTLQILADIARKLDKKAPDSDDDDSSVDPSMSKAHAAFSGTRRMRRNLEKTPMKVVQDYEKRVLEELGISDQSRQFWKFRDYSRRWQPVFGKMKGMYRMHYYLSEILELHRAGLHERAIGYTTQCLKALQQVAIDGGSWTTASELLPTHDPLAKEIFGGTEAELEAIHRRTTAIRELQQNLRKQEGPKEEA